LDSVNLRVFAYSVNVYPFNGDSGCVAKMQFIVNHNMAGDYPVSLSNVILVDDQLNNVIYDDFDGTIHILGPLNTTWVGTISNNWYTTTNWSNGFPTEFSTVNISAGTPFQPIINQDVSILKLILLNNAVLEISNDSELTIR